MIGRETDGVSADHDLAPVRSDPLLAANERSKTRAARLTDVARSQLEAWNATQQSYCRDDCVPQLIAARAGTQPGAVALVADNRTLTYRELNRLSNQLAHYLRALGVGPDTLVAVCMERSVDMVVALLGVLKAGGAYVPLDPTYPPLRLSFMLEDTQAPVLITVQSQVARLPAHNAQVVCLDTDAAVLAQQSTADPAQAAAAAHLAYVIYTSGSTGQPKGVQIAHESLLNLIFWHQQAFAVTPLDRATQLAGPAFDATVWELWPYLTIGASVYLPDEDTRVSPLRLRDWLVERGITITFLPTTLAEGVLALEWPRHTTLRYLLTGADTLHHYPSPDLPFTLVNNYGPTENTVVTTSGAVPPTTEPDALPSIGRPIANAQVYILDEQLRQVPIGETGELYIGGASLSRGYLHRPDLTAERFIAHPFSDEPGRRLYRTGDLARFLPDGQIAFLGRVDTQVKIRGHRIEPDEIVCGTERPSSDQGQPRHGHSQRRVVGRQESAGVRRSSVRRSAQCDRFTGAPTSASARLHDTGDFREIGGAPADAQRQGGSPRPPSAERGQHAARRWRRRVRAPHYYRGARGRDCVHIVAARPGGAGR